MNNASSLSNDMLSTAALRRVDDICIRFEDLWRTGQRHRLEEFLSGLRTAWREGEVRPTAQPKPKAKRERRRPDPFAAVTAQLHAWFLAEPWLTARELLGRLQAAVPDTYPEKLLRTLQRRVKQWRGEAARRLVFGTEAETPADIG